MGNLWVSGGYSSLKSYKYYTPMNSSENLEETGHVLTFGVPPIHAVLHVNIQLYEGEIHVNVMLFTR